RRDVRQDAIRRQLRGLGGDGVCALADELVELAWFAANDEQETLLRSIGWILVTNARQDLWRLVYLESQRGSSYVVGDEVRFLLHQPSAAPTPLLDEGM